MYGSLFGPVRRKYFALLEKKKTFCVVEKKKFCDVRNKICFAWLKKKYLFALLKKKICVVQKIVLPRIGVISLLLLEIQ